MKHFIFDWGDTIMRDDPRRTDAMYLWPHVELVAGAEEVLSCLSRTTYVSLATNAVPSDEKMIRKALARVGVDQYFRSIFCAQMIGRKKNESEFWLHVLRTLGAKAEEVTVVGDNFAGDVASPVSVGLRAVWLNGPTTEVRRGDRYHTIHHLTSYSKKRKSPTRRQSQRWGARAHRVGNTLDSPHG